jgi:predicted PurR-regulated permease PerM/methylmalonyl-CoA mutase cobalamin-binding subunit
MARSQSFFTAPRFLMLASICIVVAALYLAQEVLIPFSMAVLLSFLLAPLCNRLEHWRLGRVPSVLISVTLTFAVIGAVGWMVASQVVDLAYNLPEYRDNIRQKLQRIPWPAEGAFTRASQTVREISEDVGAGETARRGPLLTVEATPREPTALETLRDTVGPWLYPLGVAGMVVILVLFFLVLREDLRDRLIRLIGHTQINLTTQALDDAAHRVSRYLLAVSILAGVHGTIVAIGLSVIGVPNAILWGLISGLMRFVPFVGPWLAAALPSAFAFAVFPHWGPTIATIGFLAVLELTSNNVVEPWLYGTSTGVSPVAVLTAAIFWTWLWGPIGLLLATPLTVCLVVMGRYVPHLNFLYVLLGDQPALEARIRVYQRLLAMDLEEATELMEEYLEERPLEEVYETVLIPALRLAEEDRHRGTVDQEHLEYLRKAFREIVETVGEKHVRSAVQQPGEQEGEHAEPYRQYEPESEEPKIRILCLPASDEADELCGMMLSQVLRQYGLEAEAVSTTSLASEMVEMVDQRGADVVVVSALPPAAVSHSRYLCKRLHARRPKMNMVVGVWTAQIDLKKARNRIACGGSISVVNTLAKAREQVRQLIQPMLIDKSNAASVPSGT